MISEKDKKSLCGFLSKNKILTLCAYANDDFWSASCFYDFNEDSMSFTLVTNVKTRHGSLMAKNPIVVGTVLDSKMSVASLQGVQFNAEAEMLNGDKKKDLLGRYYRRFPAARMMDSTVWSLNLNQIKMTASKLGIRKKIEWIREASMSQEAVS